MDWVMIFILGIIIFQNIILHLAIRKMTQKRSCECKPVEIEQKDPYKDWRDPVTGLLKANKVNK